MNKENLKLHIINIPREEINCSRCKHNGEQTCVPYSLGCQYESNFLHRSPRLSQAQLNRINEIVRNLQQENKQLKEKIDKAMEYIDDELCENGSGNVSGSDLPYYCIEKLIELLKGE